MFLEPLDGSSVLKINWKYIYQITKNRSYHTKLMHLVQIHLLHHLHVFIYSSYDVTN